MVHFKTEFLYNPAMNDLIYINHLLLQEISQLRSVIDCLPGDIYWKDLSGAYLGRNASAKRSMVQQGFGGQEVIGLTDHDIFPEGTAKEFTGNDKFVITNDSEEVHEETIILPDGTIDINYSIKRPLKHRGKTVGVIGSSFNITHLKYVENELKALKEQLEHAELSKEAFLKNIEHDLKTPSSIISLSTSQLRNCHDDGQKTELLDNIDFSSKQILDHFTQLIEFTRLNSQQQTYALEPVDMNYLLRRIIQGFKVKKDNSNVDIALQVSNKFPSAVFSSSYALSRIISNLLENSFKFTPEGRITVSADFVDSNKDFAGTLILKIKDTGIGIHPEDISHIFEPFYKNHSSLKAVGSGSGLGLSIVKELIHNLKGTVNVASDFGKGVEIVCEIPIHRVGETSDVCDLELSCDLNRDLQILLIEDNAICAKLTSHLLEERGYQVRVAKNRCSAHRFAEQYSFDIILTDIDLGDANGIELSASLKSLYPALSNTLVYTLSAHSAESYAHEISKYSISACLNKPFDIRLFEEQVMRSFEKI